MTFFFIVVSTFAILGMQLFGGEWHLPTHLSVKAQHLTCTSAGTVNTMVRREEQIFVSAHAGRFDFDNGKPRTNFDNFWTAFLSMFQVASQQNWPYVMFDSMRVAGKVSQCSHASLADAVIPMCPIDENTDRASCSSLS